MTSPYAFYQFWLNTEDADVVDRLKIFTFLSREEIERLGDLVASEPFRREAQRRLAWEVTALVHGDEAAANVIAASEALFGQGDLATLPADVLEAALRELPNTTTAPSTPVAQLLADTALTASVSEARRAIAQGGVYVNNVRVDDDDAVLQEADLIAGMAVLRRGKKTLAGVFVV
jgi:tyrosyl-tRNA synthetase